MGQSHLFTSESVTEGHPDKIADQISDGVLDAVLADDPYGRVACETLITTGQVMVAGEISTSTYVNIPQIVRGTVRRIGYDRAKYGFDCETCGVSVALDEQSPDIAQGVNHALEARGRKDSDPYDLQGAGDQGLMFGYASDETRRAHAAADHPGAPPLRAAGGDAPLLHDLPAARRQVAGHRPLRGRRAPGGHVGRDLHPARARRVGRPAARRGHRPGRPPGARGLRDVPALRDHVLHQPDRPLRRRRPARRLPASPAARSSSTPTAAWRATAAAPSPGRTRPRSTARRPTPRAGWRRTSWRPAWRSAARCRWPTPSGSPTRCR